MNKKKIWFVREGDNLPLDGNNQKLFRVGLVCKNLLEHDDLEILWWTSEFNHSKKTHRSKRTIDYNMTDNYTIRMMKGFGYKKNFSIRRILHNILTARTFKRLSSKETKPDIIIGSIPTIETAFQIVKYGKRNNIPTIIDVRDLWPDLYIEYAPKPFKWFIRIAILPLKRKMRWLMKNASNIYATSDRFLSWALDYANREQRISDKVFNVAYEKSEYSNLENEIEHLYNIGINKNDFVCCFFGQFGNAVDIETVLMASKLFCDDDKVKFVICGVGEKIDKYKKITEGQTNVIYPGWVNQREIAALGHISSVGLMSYVPNKNYEMSMPNKFGEYLSMGLVILLQPKGVMEDLINQYKCGFQYSSSEELYKHIMILKNDRKMVEDMKNNSMILFEERFNSLKVYKQYADSILEVISKEESNEI